ncbi:hypothetical protein JCM8097_002921 [Rhodosporidiobolus ruineniae]
MAKRQLGIAEAFSKTVNTLRTSPPPAKRARLSASPPRSAAPPSTSAPSSTTAKPAAAASDPSAAISLPAFDPAAFALTLSTSPPADNPSSASEADLLALECASLDPSWLSHLQSELRKPYFLELKRFLWGEGLRGTDDGKAKGKLKVFPPARDVYAWSRYTPLEKVKVVIIGQDPYHDDGQAHGLCFSVRPGVKIPPSLRNIYKELKEEYPDFVVPTHGNLISLARRGVLLLNTSLTVKPHQAGSHSNKGWETFTDRVVDLVNKKEEGVVVMAWGAWAAKRVAGMDKKKHLILTSPHPSPLSARRGFFGNGHFKKANEWLEAKYGADAIIDWTHLESEPEETGLQNAAPGVK